MMTSFAVMVACIVGNFQQIEAFVQIRRNLSGIKRPLSEYSGADILNGCGRYLSQPAPAARWLYENVTE